MTFSEAARLSRISRKKLEADIDKFCEPYRPKLVEEKIENGVKIKVYEARKAMG